MSVFIECFMFSRWDNLSLFPGLIKNNNISRLYLCRQDVLSKCEVITRLVKVKVRYYVWMDQCLNPALYRYRPVRDALVY